MADQLISMYVELRRRRNLGRRGRLDPANQDLLSLPKSAVVASMSALDAYIHSVLYERIPIALRANPIPDALCDAMAEVLPVKNANTFRNALPVLSSADSLNQLCVKLREKSLGFVTYQAPDKIIAGYALLGQDQIFRSVADIWQGPGTSEDEIKRRLAGYAKRRNQIAHEGDRDAHGNPRPMEPYYATSCRHFIDGLASRLNRVVYGVLMHFQNGIVKQGPPRRYALRVAYMKRLDYDYEQPITANCVLVTEDDLFQDNAGR